MIASVLIIILASLKLMSELRDPSHNTNCYDDINYDNERMSDKNE